MFSIIGESNVSHFTKESNLRQVYHYACLSTDTKPTTGISNGSTCIVMDTGKTYIFDEENGEWDELPGSGGGGGGGDGNITFAEVTMDLTTELGTPIPILFLTSLKLPGLEMGEESFICQWAEAENGKVSIPMYNGQGYFYGAGGYDSGSGTSYISSSPFTLSGDIEDSEDGGYIVTGDCAISGHLTEQWS